VSRPALEEVVLELFVPVPPMPPVPELLEEVVLELFVPVPPMPPVPVGVA
jgi:hypothetical protein